MDDYPLRWLFVDMNSYFASVEQQLRPELRGKPTVVVPVMTDSTCCIAASYEARKYGIKTGTNVAEARKLYKELKIVESRPEKYIEIHHKIVSAVSSVLPVDSVLSIDEMSCRLTGKQTVRENAVEIGREVKRAIREQVGEYVKCSVGIAPNRFIAKVASDMEKPDGVYRDNEGRAPSKAVFAVPDGPSRHRQEDACPLEGPRHQYHRSSLRSAGGKDPRYMGECSR